MNYSTIGDVGFERRFVLFDYNNTMSLACCYVYQDK